MSRTHESREYESLAVEVTGQVAQVTLLGPGKGNAMGPAFWKELPVVFRELDACPEIRAIVLTGSGKHFSFGLDLIAMGSGLPGAGGGEASARSRTNFHTMVKEMQDSITAVAECRTPTIAAVHGWCIGGGVDLISAVDIRYASADAKFSVREVKLAIVAEETKRAKTLFIGDGINDAPALAIATVGLAFGQANDIAGESAGAVIMDSSLSRVDEFFHISQRMRTIALQSALGGMFLSIAGMFLAATGRLPPTAGALLQEAIDVAAVLNAVRTAWPPRRMTDF